MRDEHPHTPTPRVLYVHDDLTDDVHREYGAESEAARLTQALFDLARRDPARVVVLAVDDQVERLLARGGHAPFAMTVGIGRAGERVAELVHERTGWFPLMRRVEVTREENSRGGYDLVSTSGNPLGPQLLGLDGYPSLAVVDDTIFSGLTMRGVLRALPTGVLARTHTFCLRCVEESLRSIAELCPVSAGLAASGRILHDISFINASGLVRRLGIRRAGKPPQAFFERPAWIRAWFPGYAEEVLDACRRLNGLLEPGGVSLPGTDAPEPRLGDARGDDTSPHASSPSHLRNTPRGA